MIVLANIAAPKILNMTGNVAIIFSIIPVEALVIWSLFKFRSKVKLGIYKVLIMTLVANIATSIIGIPFAFNNMYTGSPGTAVFSLPIFFVFSCLIEWSLYISLFKPKNSRNPEGNLFLATFLSNLASYAIFFFVLLPVSYPSNLLWQPNPERAHWEAKQVIPTILSYQYDFYGRNSQFASTFKELTGSTEEHPFGFSKIQLMNDRTIENEFHQFKLSADLDKTTVKVTAKRETFKSYTAIIVVANEKSENDLLRGICQTDQPSIVPPDNPQLIEGKIQCPSGSSFLY
ncbi:MAG: type IV pilin-like G/H family protein [Coleofasciculus sp. B1-GNL1-01]|uniref:type IV pilin-like G/H family protein n=1 Tax=Coleofasciculus sp. B1-GNL1-01 TaxID=3068484 RepID=UPI0032FAD62F